MNKKVFCFECALGLTAAFFHVCHVAPEASAEHILIVAPSPEQQPMDDIAEQDQEHASVDNQVVEVAPVRTTTVTVDMPMGVEFGSRVVRTG